MRTFSSLPNLALAGAVLLVSGNLDRVAVALPPAPPDIREDIDFSRDLARHRYFDLAVEWLKKIEKDATDDEARNRVALAKATIARLASEHALTVEDRKRYYDEAIQHYTAAIDGMGRAMTVEKGTELVDGFASTLLSKGNFYADVIDRLRASEAAESEILVARTAAEEAFREAVKTLNGAYAELTAAAPDAGEKEAARLSELALFALYRRGEAYYQWALLYPLQDFNRNDYLQNCANALVDYIWEAGGESIWAFWAYYYQGMAEYQRGRIELENAADHDEKALASLTHIFSPDGIDIAELPKIGEEERRFVLSLLEKAYLGVTQVYRDAANRFEASQTITDTDDLTSKAQQYLVVGDANWMAKPPVYRPALVGALRRGAIEMMNGFEAKAKEYKLEFGPDGDRALLEKVRVMIDMGTGADALPLVQRVAEKNDRNVVGLEAQNLLGDLIDVAGGSQPPSVLRLAADGHIADGRWLDAIPTLHQLAVACRSDDEKKEYLANAWKDIGGAYQSLGRNLEASIAYEQGLDTAKELSDEEAMGELALEAYTAWDRRYTETKQDFDKTERNRVREIVTQLGVSGDIQFLKAREAYSNAAAASDTEERKELYAAAIEELDAVHSSSTYYERAMIYKARSQDGAGRPDDAIKTFDNLLERIASTNVGFSKKQKQQRDIAHAQAVFYRSGVLLDQKRYQDVFDSLNDYEGKFESQAAFFPHVTYYRIRALVGLEQYDAAESLLSGMQSKYPKHTSIQWALNTVATGYFDAFKKNEQAPDAKTYLRKAADYLDEYNALTGYSSFTNLKNVADWYYELRELELAVESYERLVSRYGKKPQYQPTIEQQVMEPYSGALVQLHRFHDALPLCAEVYAAKRRVRSAVRNYALCLGGWMEEEEKGRDLYEYKEIPGAAQYQEAMAKWLELKKGIEDANEKASEHWWDAVTNYMYCQYMQAKINPQEKVALDKVIKNYKTFYPDLGGGKWKRIITRIERAVR